VLKVYYNVVTRIATTLILQAEEILQQTGASTLEPTRSVMNAEVLQVINLGVHAPIHRFALFLKITTSYN
jgi:hypothetical protein